MYRLWYNVLSGFVHYSAVQVVGSAMASAWIRLPGMNHSCHGNSMKMFFTQGCAWKCFPLMGSGCRSVDRASDWHAANTGSIPRCGKGFFSQSQLSVQILLRCLYTPVCNCIHLHLCACKRSRSPCQTSVDYGNTEHPACIV